jgi:hypothetical protein
MVGKVSRVSRVSRVMGFVKLSRRSRVSRIRGISKTIRVRRDTDGCGGFGVFELNRLAHTLERRDTYIF